MVMLTTRHSCRDICTVLHIPNFFVFSAGYQPGIAESVSYSHAIALWSAFMEMAPQLRTDIEACPPTNWDQLTEASKFSWVVSRYCDMRGSPAPTSFDSRALSTHDHESLSGNTEGSESSPQSFTETLFGWDAL